MLELVWKLVEIVLSNPERFVNWSFFCFNEWTLMCFYKNSCSILAVSTKDCLPFYSSDCWVPSFSFLSEALIYFKTVSVLSGRLFLRAYFSRFLILIFMSSLHLSTDDIWMYWFKSSSNSFRSCSAGLWKSSIVLILPSCIRCWIDGPDPPEN